MNRRNESIDSFDKKSIYVDDKFGINAFNFVFDDEAEKDEDDDFDCDIDDMDSDELF